MTLSQLYELYHTSMNCITTLSQLYELFHTSVNCIKNSVNCITTLSQLYELSHLCELYHRSTNCITTLSQLYELYYNSINCKGGSPGQVIMGGDSCSEGCGFKSLHHLLGEHFFTLICCKICNDVCLKRPKINDNRGRGWPILKTLSTLSQVIL